MIDDIRKANESVTASSRNIAILRQHFPGCFTKDGTFDIEKFKELISDDIIIDYQGHGLRYLGQQYARLLMNEDTTTVVAPNEEHNNKPENANSQNIFISGDNLDALKHLLHSYAGKVKLIYIDPPYNTGSDDFVYQDKFNFTVEELAEKLSISEEHAERILNMTRGKSSSHSAWLTFMEPRLRLARELLSEDGLIFISIDDNELANLKLLCDDIFGEENYRNQIVVRRGTKNVQAQFETWDKLGQAVEYVLFYSKNHKYRFPKQQKELDDPRPSGWNNHWRGTDRPTMRYTLFGITPETGQWRWEKPRSLQAIKNYQRMLKELNVSEDEITQDQIDQWYEAQDEEVDLLRLSPDGVPEHYVPASNSTLLNTSWVDVLAGGSSEIISLFQERIFDTAKLTRFLKRVISFADKDALILDFFAGSASMAHAVMELNAKDSGNRRFIMVQLQEPVKPDSRAAKAGYKTIDQIAMDRIMRAAKQIRKEYPDINVDLGFKHYTLVEPSIQTLDKLDRFDPNANLVLADETILDAFGVPTVLTTWLVRDGYGLAAEPQPIDFKGYTGYYIGQHLYLIEPNPTEANITAIVDRLASDPEIQVRHVVLFGYSFTWTQLESIKTNLRQLKDSERNLSLSIYTRY